MMQESVGMKFVKNKTRLPKWGHGVYSVLKRNFLYSRYTWLYTFIWTFIEPLLYLTALGYGLGSFIPEIQGQSYLDFYFPGLIAITAMFVPFFEATYTYYSKLRFEKTYNTILLSPISVSEILWGEILWAAFKGFFSGSGVALLGVILGILNGTQFLLCLSIIFMIAFVFGALGMLFTTMAKNYDFFYVAFSGLVLPMSLFSDTYYPMDKYPEQIQWALQIFPSVHGVKLLRFLIHPPPTTQLPWLEPALHFIALFFFLIIFTQISYRRFTKILMN